MNLTARYPMKLPEVPCEGTGHTPIARILPPMCRCCGRFVSVDDDSGLVVDHLRATIEGET